MSVTSCSDNGTSGGQSNSENDVAAPIFPPQKKHTPTGAEMLFIKELEEGFEGSVIAQFTAYKNSLNTPKADGSMVSSRFDSKTKYLLLLQY